MDKAPVRTASRDRGRGRRWALGAAAAVAAGAAGLALLAGLGAWRDREALGARLAIDALRKRGVPASVRITRLDAGGVEGSLSLGPPGAPDLTVERFRAEFEPWPGPLGGRLAPRIRRLVLVRPHLRARWDGRRLSVGALQPLLDEALSARPGAGGPAPDVRIEDGALDLATSYGPVAATGDATLGAGRLDAADVGLLAPALAKGGLRLEGLQGRLRVRRGEGDRLRLGLAASARAASGAGARAQAVEATGSADLPYGRDARRGLDGRAVATLLARAHSLQGAGVEAQAARLEARFDGVLDRGGEHAVGALRLHAGAAHAARGAVALADLALDLSTGALDAFAARGGPVLRAPLAVTVAAGGGEAPAAGGRLRVEGLRLAGRGRLAYARGLALNGEVSASAAAGLDAAAAARLAQGASPGEGGAPTRAALARAAGAMRLAVPQAQVSLRGAAWRLALTRPLQVDFAGGARLAATSAEAQGAPGSPVRGRLYADLAGGGLPTIGLRAPSITVASGRSGVRAEAPGVELAAAGSLGPLREARLRFAGGLAWREGALTAVAARCLPVTVAAVAGSGPQPVVSGVSARACPDGATPLLVAGRGGWRLATRVQALSLAAPGARLAVADASGALRLSGRGGAPEGAAELASAVVRDTSAPLRFEPLAVAGPAILAGGEVRARLTAALLDGRRPLGPLVVTQRLDSGAGGLTLDVPGLAFAPDALQPAAVLPALAPFAHDVRGVVSGGLQLSWDGAGAHGSARARTAGLDLVSAAGPVHGLTADVAFTSLDPLVTAPGQRVTAARLETLLPLTDLSARVTLQPAALRVEEASAGLAGGRVSLDPLRAPLAPGSTVSGVARAQGVRLGTLLDTVNLGRALQVEARLRGVVPFSVGPQGVRIAGGELAAEGPGRLTLQRSALTGVSADGGPAGAPPSAAQDFAFQALEDLAFSALEARVDSRPKGRLGVLFHVKGRHDPAVGRSARVGLLDLLRGRAFQKSIPLPKGTDVDLTLDTSLNFDDLYRAWLGLGASAAATAPPAPGSAKVQP